MWALCAWTVGCGGSEEPASKPAAEAKGGPAVPPTAAAKADDGRVKVTLERFGKVTSQTAPKRIDLMKAMGEGWDAAESATEKGAVTLTRGGSAVADVYADVSGNYIDRVVTTHPDVVFPWDTSVGGRIGGHKHWDRMGCEAATGRFAGKAVCRAYEDRRFEYVVDLEGKAAITDQAELVDHRIAAMIWRPKPASQM
jgi:hypothetical protein